MMQYKFTYLLTTNCNYNCGFCPIKRNEIFSSEKVINSISNFMLNINSDKSLSESLRINISGGEPTIHPLFMRFINSFVNSNIIIHVYSNLSADIKLYTNIMDNISNIHFDFTYHNNHIDYETFYNKLKYLISYRDDVSYCINYNLGKNRLSSKQIYTLFDSLLNSNVRILMNTLFTETSDLDNYYSHNDILDFTNTDIMVNTSNLNYGKYTQCHLTHGTISSTGYLYHCNTISTNIPVLDITKRNANKLYKLLHNKTYKCNNKVCCYLLPYLNDDKLKT